MDLGTVLQRVKNRYYRSVDELIADMRLVIDNCRLFNPPDSSVCRKCKKLEKRLNRVLAKMPAGEEVPYQKKESESFIMRQQCK
ncbi:hypothetical protein KR222_010441, partial [Zaprionus bogoriensis]